MQNDTIWGRKGVVYSWVPIQYSIAVRRKNETKGREYQMKWTLFSSWEKKIEKMKWKEKQKHKIMLQFSNTILAVV